MSTDRYRIGEFTLDVSQGCLRRGDIEVPLRPKSFALLQHLITHAGRLVTKDELLSKIWPNVIVTEDSLTRCISEARAALGDTEQTAIKTVSKRGYIFAAPVIQAGDDPAIQPAPDMVPVKEAFFRGTGERHCWPHSASSRSPRRVYTPRPGRGTPPSFRACR